VAVKDAQKLTVWLLPLIVIGGLFFPILGYLTLGMMIFLIILSLSRGRYWCWNLCPRGAFLDIVVSKIGFKKSYPKIFSSHKFRWGLFILFISFLVLRLGRSGGGFIAVGAVFVGMCVITTLIAIIIGISTRHKGWCMICPMGTLQGRLGKINKKSKEK
jgi:polyferredoxin